jgi:hypothetical protein
MSKTSPDNFWQFKPTESLTAEREQVRIQATQLGLLLFHQCEVQVNMR